MASLSQLKKRKPNFSDTEILNFLKILERRRSLINGESTLFGDALLGAWNEVAEEYSATAMVPRNGEELRSKFTDLKSRTKKRLKQIKNQQTPNGGVPSQIKPYEELVLQLASRNPLNGFNEYVDTFSEAPPKSPVKEELIETEDAEFKVIPAEPALIPIRVAPIPQRSASKRKKPFIDDFDREMLEIAKRNVALQEQRLIETKLSNSLLCTIASKLGCQCQNKS